MTTRSICYVSLFLALSLLLLVACNQPDTSPTEILPAEVQPTASATPLPASAQSEINDFVNQQQAIDQQWDQIRVDFDQWRAELTSCHPNSVHEALNDFAVAFNDVTEQARNLTRAQSTQELADTLIVAAEAEETALRQLRDRWQPNNVALFEEVEQRRSDASHAQKDAQDQAIELRLAAVSGVAPESTDEFAQSFDLVKNDWQTVHDEYSDLLDKIESMEPADVIASLDQLVEKFTLVVDAVNELPAPTGAESTVEALQSAAQAELDAFNTAREPSDKPELPDFSGIDASVKASEDALADTGQTISNAPEADPTVSTDPEESLAELQVFYDEYDSLVVTWNEFHDRYNDWRASEGGCDRTEVTQALEQFSLRTGAVARDVRDLPRAGYLLPMYTSLVDAAGREENAIRTLRNSWQPFTVDAFKAVDEDRINVDGLRREADIALQQLRNRF
jgi:hypothetical protein